MYVAPTTNIKLLTGVPLDNRYINTIYFTTDSAQRAYFNTKVKHTLTQQSYQRVNKGIARVARKAEDCYDCTYMMFQNEGFGNKWFYAFINSVEYINNETTEITFEIDVLQSWLFSFIPTRSFVERMHVDLADDLIGNHIEPEPVEPGEYVFNGNYHALWPGFENLCVIMSIVDTNNGASGSLVGGVFSGASLWVFNKTDANGINAKIDEYNKSPESITGLYMVPVNLIDGSIPAGGRKLGNWEVSKSYSPTDIALPTLEDTLDGYKPKNPKMYTYPYNFFQVDNASGSSLALRYEFSQVSGYLNMVITGTATMPVMATLYPTLYKNVGGGTSANNGRYGGESLSLGNFPMCSWNVDSYQAWVAQNALPLGIESGMNIAGSAVGFATGNPIGATNGILGTIANVATQYYRASNAADLCKGNYNNGGVNSVIGMNQFFGGRMSVTANYAKMIDDFFEMFGYAVKRVISPNRNQRPHWTYLKTVGCNGYGQVPADDIAKICSLYDAGITWWKNGSEVGNYQLNNH